MKLEPMLEKVEQAQRNIEIARATHGGQLSSDPGKIGMLAKMGGRMMHYYADDLAEMMLDDMLGDVAIDLQLIEHKQRDKVAIHESKQLAENIMKHITDFQSEQELVKMRWTNEELQKIKGSKIDIEDIRYDIQPKAI